jgi:hypothetical protein
VIGNQTKIGFDSLFPRHTYVTLGKSKSALASHIYDAGREGLIAHNLHGSYIFQTAIVFSYIIITTTASIYIFICCLFILLHRQCPFVSHFQISTFAYFHGKNKTGAEGDFPISLSNQKSPIFCV